MLFWYATLIKRLVTLYGEGIGVESNERVFRAVLLERVIECEKTGKVCRVGNQSRPYCTDISICSPNAPRRTGNIPFFDSTPAGFVVALVVACMLLICISIPSRANKVSHNIRSQ
jgi:hypothetical protein